MGKAPTSELPSSSKLTSKEKLKAAAFMQTASLSAVDYASLSEPQPFIKLLTILGTYLYDEPGPAKFFLVKDGMKIIL